MGLVLHSTSLFSVAQRQFALLRGTEVPFFFQLVIVFFISITINASSHADTMYKSVRPDGRVVYSDRPPAEGRIEKTMTFENLPSSALPKETSSYVEQLKRLRASAPVVASREGVVLYSATWCGYCTKAKAYLVGKGISYQEIDIDTDDGKAAFAQAGGGKGVPLLLVGGKRAQGFSIAAYDEIFASKR